MSSPYIDLRYYILLLWGSINHFRTTRGNVLSLLEVLWGLMYFLLLWHTWAGEEVGSMERLWRSWGQRGARRGDDPMGTPGRGAGGGGGGGMFLFLGWMVLILGRAYWVPWMVVPWGGETAWRTCWVVWLTISILICRGVGVGS